jgi:hypothetical protein
MTFHKATIIDGIGVRSEASAHYIDEYTRELFEKTCEAVLKRPNISNEERHLFEAEAETFARSLDDICKIKDKQTRETAHRAAMSALSIGYFHATRVPKKRASWRTSGGIFGG